MLEFPTPAGTGEIENSWGELSPAQFIETTALTNQFFAVKFDFDEYRLRLLEMLTGYKRKNKRNKFAEQINENLYLISEQLTFAVSPKIGPPEILEFFSPELREVLKTRFPWEIYEPEFVEQLLTVKDMLTIEYALNFDLGKNLLPFVRNGKAVLRGPVFDTSDGDIETNLTTGKYLDAQEYFNAYSNSKNPKYLDAFIGCLYQYDKDYSGEIENLPNLVEKKTKDAIVLLFMYMQQTFINDPIFGILFTGESENKKLSLGASEAVYQVVEQGYGNHTDVVNMNIRDFFNIQIMILKKNVAQLRGMDKKVSEIATEMNLPIEIVTQL